MITLKIKLLIAFILILIAGLAIAGFLFFAQDKNEKLPLLSAEENISATPYAWIEIRKPLVSELSADEKILRDFKTNDVVSEGMIISVGLNGYALIHFPDNSVARLESETKLKINEIKFSTSDKTLTAKLNLLTGRIWSKIMQLATPQSIWEVKTANAVATVRGTSFGVSYLKEKTNVVGLENKVAVSPIDPKTNEILKNIKAIVEPKKMVILAAAEMEKIKERQKIEILEIKNAPPEIKAEIQQWVETNKAEDIRYEKTIETIQEKNIESEKIQVETKISSEPETVPEPLPLKQPAISPEQTKEQISPSINKKIISLEITGSLEKPMIEGEIIQFKAFAVTDAGEKIDVTGQTKWQVLGNIGIISAGKFQAQLIGEIAEQGFAIGNVIAVWKDPSTGKEFLINSPFIRVEAAPIEAIKQEG